MNASSGAGLWPTVMSCFGMTEPLETLGPILRSRTGSYIAKNRSRTARITAASLAVAAPRQDGGGIDGPGAAHVGGQVAIVHGAPAADKHADAVVVVLVDAAV